MKRSDCRCTHSKALHEHFSTGSAIHATWCALCDCQRYKRVRVLLTPFWAHLRREFRRDRCPHPNPLVFIEGTWNCTRCNREVY